MTPNDWGHVAQAIGPTLLGAAGLGAYANGRRSEKRKDRTEPVDSVVGVVGAAAQVAGAVEDILKPLREEISNLHAEVTSSNRMNAELRAQLIRRDQLERDLRAEVTALRLEVAALRGVIAAHGGIDISHIESYANAEHRHT